jgi:FixJ family two-component response regulator
MAQNNLNQIIAEKLNIQYRTVEHYVATINDKMRQKFACHGRNMRSYLGVVYREWKGL